MSNDNETIEGIEACRTCGIYYMTTSNYLKPLFQSPVEQPEMMLIRLELAQWKVEVGENDGFPQHVCSTCVHEFQKVFKFRTSCVDTQEQFRHYYSIREENRANIKIKTELPDPAEDQTLCDFIYVDELSDTEYDGATPFNIPHVPIKEELIEAATIPMEETAQSLNMVESAARVVNLPAAPSLNQTPPQPAPIAQNESITKTSPVVVQMPQESEVECKLCQHLSANQEEHKQHLQRAHETKDMECHICGKKFKNSTPSRMKFHMKWHNLNKHVKCAQCGFVCNSKEALQEHKRANHTKMHCKICGKGVIAKKMKSHLREHELLTKFPCEYCTEAFTSENERETHIWQTHADEDINEEIPTTSAEINVQETSENILNIPTVEDEELCHESQEVLDNYKFFCANCEKKFIEQIDLEIHVNEEHRPKAQIITTTELETPSTSHDLINMSTSHDSHHDMSTTHDALNDNNDDQTPPIAVFEDYDNENSNNELQQNESVNKTSDLQSEEHYAADFIQSNNYNNTPESVIIQQDEEDNDQELTDEINFEVSQSRNEVNNSAQPVNEYTDTSESEEDSQSYASSFVSNEMHPFACAKCSETFATIEQLRIHYEKHLSDTSIQQAPSQQQSEAPQKTKKFKCHLCGKTFDLKFSLNRHVKKHKHAPL